MTLSPSVLAVWGSTAGAKPAKTTASTSLCEWSLWASEDRGSPGPAPQGCAHTCPSAAARARPSPSAGHLLTCLCQVPVSRALAAWAWPKCRAGGAPPGDRQGAAIQPQMKRIWGRGSAHLGCVLQTRENDRRAQEPFGTRTSHEVPPGRGSRALEEEATAGLGRGRESLRLVTVSARGLRPHVWTEKVTYDR